MKTLTLRTFAAATLFCTAQATFAQGLLTPPGPPGPTMKTLQQVEPRTPIGSLPFTITESGSYYLTTNLGGGAGFGLIISNSHVTLDLMGFEIAGGTGVGISVFGARSNIWIRNGSVRGWDAWGVDADAASNCLLENLRVTENGFAAGAGGLRLGSRGIVKNCAASGNAGPGLQVSGEHCRIENNHFTLNGRGLLVTGTSNVIIHNSASGNAIDYDVAPGNDLGPIGRAATLSSPWGNIGAALFSLTVARTGDGSGTVTSSPAGINCGVDCSEDYAEGTVVTLTATADAGSTFTGWSGGGCMGTGGCTVTMDAAKTVTATFTLTTYALTVSKAGTGNGTVTSSPAGVNCGVDCNESYTSGTVVTLTAAASPGSTFSGWSGACTGTGACTVTMDAAKSVTATFTLDTFTLTTTRASSGTGTITSSPAGVNCGADCNESYTSGTVVTLTATPASGSTFAGWSGGGCSGTGACVVTMDAAKAVTATFSLNSYTLSTVRAGSGTGTITSSPAGINCGTDCNEVFNHGTMVTLTAAPAVGSAFAGWSGGGCSGTGTCVVTVDAAKTVTATFNVNTFLLTVAKSGSGTGTVTSSPAGINCNADCTEAYVNGTIVTLTASAAGGSTFTGWTGGGCSGTGTCNVTMDAAKTVTASFSSP